MRARDSYRAVIALDELLDIVHTRIIMSNPHYRYKHFFFIVLVEVKCDIRNTGAVYFFDDLGIDRQHCVGLRMRIG